MKKGVLIRTKIGFTTTLAGLFSISSVFAQQTNFQIWGSTFAGNIAGLFDKFYLDPKNSSSILMGILVFMVIYSVIKEMSLFQTEDSTSSFFWSGSVALIVTLLSLIYLPSNFMQMTGPQYGALAGTILTIIPLLIMIYFSLMAIDSLLIARLIWIVYIFYYFIIFIDFISITPNWNFNIFDFNGNPAAPYMWGMILGVIMFLFVRPLRAKFYKELLESKKEKGKRLIKNAAYGARILSSATEEFGRKSTK